jgi:SAM-dependent methyltransferase
MLSTLPESKASDEEVIDWLRLEYQQEFKGWDFSYAEQRRLLLHSTTWDYAASLVRILPRCPRVLEVDTGGGERLANLLQKSGFSGKASATEGYTPNLEIARKCLQPFGVEVVEVADTDELPFDDYSFDLVMNRHGACSSVEEFRILRPGGAFVTQLVGIGRTTKSTMSSTIPGLHRVGTRRLLPPVQRQIRSGFWL